MFKAFEQYPFDPNTWVETVSEGRFICLSDRFDVCAVLDEEDYIWARRIVWTLTRSSKRPWKNYAKRNVREGVEGFESVRKTSFLHREIMMKVEPIPLWQASTLRVDHINGDSLNNKRENLRWATDAMNRVNLLGRDHKQPDLLGYDLEQICQSAELSSLKKLKADQQPKPRQSTARQVQLRFRF